MTTRKNYVNRIKARRVTALYNLERRFPALSGYKSKKAAAEMATLRSHLGIWVEVPTSI